MPKSYPPIGAHMSVSKGFKAAFETSASIGATALQIFSKSPMAARMRAVTENEADEVAKSPARNSAKAMVIHGSYLINYAKPFSKDSFEVRSLAEDVENSDKLGGIGAVLHMGKILKLEPEKAEKIFIENIETVLKKTDGLSSAVILENMAGQGSEMCSRLEDFGRVVHKLKDHKRLKCCIDTAHLMGAGYDLSQKTGVLSAISEIETHVGWDRVACVHFNDSKKPAGSHVDRHQDIGKGCAGTEGLKLFATTFAKKAPGVPFILETPEEHLSYKEQIDLIKSWF